MPTVREQLLAAITATMSAEWAVPSPEDERDLPLTIVQDGTDEASTQYGSTACVMPLAVATAQAAASADRDALRAQAHEALGQIVVGMFADPAFGGLADGVDYVGGGIEVQIGKFVFAEAQFRVRYHHVLGDPYTIDEV